MNKNYLIGIIVLVLLSGIQNVSAVADPLEVYTKTINTNPEGYYQSIEAIVDNGDNTYTTVGTTNITGSPSVILTKLDSSGNEITNRTYNVHLQNFTLKLIKTTDGGYMFSGKLLPWQTSFVVKIKSNFDFDWQFGYNSGLYNDVTNAIQTSDGGYAIIDANFIFSTLIKLNSTGGQEWISHVGETDNPLYVYNKHSLLSVAEMSDGYLLSGYEGDGNPIANKDALLVKIWDNGTIAWQNRYSDTCDELTAIDKTSDVGFILAGGGCLYKVNSLGEREWSKSFYGPHRIHSVKQTDYGYLLSGTTQIYPHWEGNQGIAYKTDFEGNLMWQKLYNSNSIAFSAIPITSGGDYLIAGSKYELYKEWISNNTYYMRTSNLHGFINRLEEPAYVEFMASGLNWNPLYIPYNAYINDMSGNPINVDTWANFSARALIGVRPYTDFSFIEENGRNGFPLIITPYANWMSYYRISNISRESPFTTTGKGTIISVNATYNESYGVIISIWPIFPPEEVGLYYNFTDPLGNNYTDQLGYQRKFIDTKPGSIFEYRVNDIVNNGSKTYALNTTLTNPKSPFTTGITGDARYLYIRYQEIPGADSSPPNITINRPNGKYILNEAVTADYSCEDPSGVSVCSGTVPNGSNIDTSTVGIKTFSIMANDTAGNSITESITYNVTYNFTGLFSPVDNTPTFNKMKAGGAVPVKFSLNGDQGLDIFAPGYPKSTAIACNDANASEIGVNETVTAGQSGLFYDSTLDQYEYIWKTDKSWTGACSQLVMKFDDSTYQRANFEFK